MPDGRLRTIAQGRETSIVLALLAIAVLVPTVCVFWFMDQAIQNQQQVVRQKLMDAHRLQLSLLREKLEGFWQEVGAALEKETSRDTAPEAFARVVATGRVRSAIVLGPGGRVAYPGPPLAPRADLASRNADWLRAVRLEQDSANLPAAATAYGRIVSDPSVDASLAARAAQGQLRCLVRAGQHEQAVSIVSKVFGNARLANAGDLQGRLISADAELLALQILRDPESGEFRRIAKRLHARLLDYTNSPMPPDQRVFLMNQMKSLRPGRGFDEFPTLEAETLAARFLAEGGALTHSAALRGSAIPGVLQVSSPKGRLVMLLRTEDALHQMEKLIASADLSPDIHIAISPPGTRPPKSAESTPIGEALPAWHLSLVIRNESIFEQLARRQNMMYYWIAIVAAITVAGLAALAVGALRRQMRLAGLKANLAATVSHELRTPLSSMRLLVENLLEEPHPDPKKTREYLQLIERENVRLSRVIDNFLTFSRLERDHRSFEFSSVSPEAIVREAAQSTRNRFGIPEHEIEVSIEPGLPDVRADENAMVTALLNLLDNAWKYSPTEKRVVLKAYRRGNHICFEVEDNGIGFSKREAKRIFRSFYQVDRRLARGTGGCGLGLSIVDFITRAHGGEVDVESEPGRGSRFTISLPCATTAVVAPA